MPETASQHPSKPLLTDRCCKWCGDKLPITSRADTKYCCGRCRYYGAVDRGNSGRVYRTQVLKSGMVSIVIHAPEATLTAGDEIKWGKV